MSSHLQVEAAATEVAWAEVATELWLSDRPWWKSRWSVPTSLRQKSVPRMPTSTPVILMVILMVIIVVGVHVMHCQQSVALGTKLPYESVDGTQVKFGSHSGSLA